MLEPLVIFGLVFGILLLILVIMAFKGHLNTQEREREYHRHEREKETIAREIGCKVSSENYWFSESKEAAAAVWAIGEMLRTAGHWDPSKARDLYREKRREKR